MEENRYFQDALTKFTHEAAGGGAIRHLTDRGYTVAQILERLDFPVPRERVRQTVWERLMDTGILLREEPGKGGGKEKAVYVREYDRYGKSTFRRVVEAQETPTVERFAERMFVYGDESSLERLRSLLEARTRENGEDFSYASCAFGMTMREPELWQRTLQALEGQREYVEGLPWERRLLYHRLNLRMRDILGALCGAGLYQGECFFLKTKEKIRITRELD